MKAADIPPYPGGDVVHYESQHDLIDCHYDDLGVVELEVNVPASPPTPTEEDWQTIDGPTSISNSITPSAGVSSGSIQLTPRTETSLSEAHGPTIGVRTEEITFQIGSPSDNHLLTNAPARACDHLEMLTSESDVEIDIDAHLRQGHQSYTALPPEDELIRSFTRQLNSHSTNHTDDTFGSTDILPGIRAHAGVDTKSKHSSQTTANQEREDGWKMERGHMVDPTDPYMTGFLYASASRLNHLSSEDERPIDTGISNARLLAHSQKLQGSSGPCPQLYHAPGPHEDDYRDADPLIDVVSGSTVISMPSSSQVTNPMGLRLSQPKMHLLSSRPSHPTVSSPTPSTNPMPAAGRGSPNSPSQLPHSPMTGYPYPPNHPWLGDPKMYHPHIAKYPFGHSAIPTSSNVTQPTTAYTNHMPPHSNARGNPMSPQTMTNPYLDNVMSYAYQQDANVRGMHAANIAPGMAFVGPDGHRYAIPTPVHSATASTEFYSLPRHPSGSVLPTSKSPATRGDYVSQPSNASNKKDFRDRESDRDVPFSHKLLSNFSSNPMTMADRLLLGNIGRPPNYAVNQGSWNALEPGGSVLRKRNFDKGEVDVHDFKPIRYLGKGSYGKVYLVENRHWKSSHSMSDLRTAPARDSSIFRDTLSWMSSGSWRNRGTYKPMGPSEGCQRLYAMKLLNRDTVIKKKQLEHTMTENSVLKFLKHPMIVDLHFAFKSTTSVYMVMEYCPGGELFHHLSEEGRFSEGKTKFYAASILLALEHMHERGVVYRDLKPENIVIDTQGYIKLTDFGLSKANIRDNHSATSVCGTPEYLAPEVLMARGHGLAVDHWGLAALIYEMLTGLPPFYSKKREELLEGIRTGILQYPSHIHPVTKDFLQRLFVKDPKNRLGAHNIKEIKNHPYFFDVNFEALLHKETPAPFVPKITNIYDTSNFDETFTDLSVERFDNEDCISPSLDDPTVSLGLEKDLFHDWYYDVRYPASYWKGTWL